LQKLNLGVMRCGIPVFNKEKRTGDVWTTSQSDLGSAVQLTFTDESFDMHPLLQGAFEAWLKQVDFSYALQGDDLLQYYRALQKVNFQLPLSQTILSKQQFYHIATFEAGGLFAFRETPFPEEAKKVMKRFAGVFGQTYRRYLDLQKAEAQAREAQIEAALERVRSRSMAMHQSSDLHEVVKVVTEQLLGLGIKFNAANFARIHSGGNWDLWISAPDQAYPAVVEVPYLDHGLFNNIIEAIKKGHDFVADAYDQEEKNIFFKHFFENTLAKYTPDARKEWVMSCKGFARSVFLTKNIWLAVSNYEGIPFGNEENAIFKRFANAFEQAYTRFLDLQKAEANAREAQIEASLERVRSKTMAMHNSNGVGETVAAMFAEFERLGIHTNRCGILIFDDEYTAEVWTARSTPGGNAKLIVGKLNLEAHLMLRSIYNAWKAKQTFYQYDLVDEDLVRYYTAINNSKFYPTQFDLDALPSKEFHSDFFFADGAVFSFTNEPIAQENAKIMKRFAGVFGQTYRRYLDLQKAETQSRESQIQLALERVRARTMAMHRSEELLDIITVVSEQLQQLNVKFSNVSFGINNKDYDLKLWMAVKGYPRAYPIHWTFINNPGVTRLKEAQQQPELIFSDVLTQAENNEWMQHVFNCNSTLDIFSEENRQRLLQTPGYARSIVVMKEIFLVIGNYAAIPYTDEENAILKRFASVFEQSYTRFLDLQKAEAQAKEAQIEAGLERVRARTMAMHTSDDVSAATATMFMELEKLGIENFRGGITNMHPDRTQDVWSANNLAEETVVKAVGAFNIDDHPFWQLMYKEWLEKNDFTHYFLAGQEKEDYIKILNSTQGYFTRAIENFPDVHFQVYFFNEGGVWTNSTHAHTEEEQQIMKRFTTVFSLTFRRYQDLRKAEAQAREATIEAALEKVRGKAMAMHNSNDLSATASMVFTELRKLGISPIRCGVGLLNNETLKAPLYSATSTEDGDHLSLVGWVMLEGHPVLEEIYQAWLKGEDYFPQLKGDELRSYYVNLLKGLTVPVPDWKDEQVQYGHFIAFKVGCLYAWSDRRYNEEEIKVLKRFATIIDLTFRRYIELQQSEANAREAVKQAALDRIRAEIASMRTVADLDRITPLIWNELTILGLQFIRCGIFLMDDTQRLIHTFLSTPEGNAIAAFHMPYDTQSNFDEAVNNWHLKRIYITHWTEPDFFINADIMVKHGAITDREQYLRTLPPGGFYLHFLPFLQGMLYVGTIEQLGDDEISLVGSVADAFSTAYARYEDFNRLEAAKEQVEKTLLDLKQAQTLLVQSEKMASLGELTAGIAHEIQNPLNFVNNFSDVSNELLEEMKQELAKGNIDDAIAIAEDVKQNLEKINHHGKRADGIVKGMLQHSRTSSSQKELTDINALADEYLRLAFHGLRAKDKSFNAKFETNFDDNVGKIDIIQQDIGRVILNLINNAFYAVSEKKKQNTSDYEPTVTVTTRRENGSIEIAVRDNGSGISKKNLDKIFQPFFTTKPTGQGTGLGLSLAYDIVKAHGGDINVKTKEGEGSEFIIQLPV
jgi:signal transduction histidine kinase